MAIKTNELVSYDVVGTSGSVVEDLKDLITNIAPLDTLLYNAIGSGKKPINTKHEFFTETYAAAAANAQLSGDQFTVQATRNPTRLYNMCQIQWKTFMIERSLQLLKSIGNANSVEHKTALHTGDLMKDVEFAFLRGVRDDGSATVGRQMRGMLNATQSNTVLNGGSMATSGVVTGGAATDLTESMLKNMHQEAFSAGGNVTTIFCGPFQRRKITLFGGAGNYRTLIEDKKLESSVDVFCDEFGELRLRTHRNFPADVVFGCDIKTWKKSTLDPVGRKLVSTDYDGDFYRILVEHTLEFLAENANFRIVNLTTS